MNYALLAAELSANYDRGMYTREQYRTMIRALNKRFAKKGRKSLDNRKSAPILAA